MSLRNIARMLFPFVVPLLLALAVVAALSTSAAAQESVPVCFWSAQGMICVERAADVGPAGVVPEGPLRALLAGPTLREQAQGVWSAIPEGTALEGLDIQPDGTVIVRLGVPPDGLGDLDHETFEIIVRQVGWTLKFVNWRGLRIQTWDPVAEEFVPLAAFLPQIPPPRKETVLSGEEARPVSVAHAGQPPAPGQGQPEGGLSGKTVYVSAGHGWTWNDNVNAWRTQRPPYPASPYVGPIIEDHNNVEAVNQYLLQYLWNAGAQVWPVRERGLNSAERIVNNDDSTGYTEEGAWITSVYPGYDLDVPGTYRYTTTVTGTATATATWTTTLPVEGEYAVYVWYRAYADDRPPDAQYTVHHAGGQTTVLVDQQYHGITWHYIGTYGFRAGEVATVTLSNLSSHADRHVIADAVRFGGGFFDSLYGIDTAAWYPPNKPWWEVAAFYYTQKMGMDQPPGDVTARPIYARWEHAGTGDDAVYVSWHTNGYSGYQWDSSGTETYVHNGEWLPRTEGSLTLCHSIHTELVHDIRAGWDPAWVDRGEKVANFGELRLLWDDDPLVRMPGVLIEIAYHDHPADTDALKEPTFEMLAARAVYQGIVKYFEEKDGGDLTLLPEPPTHLVVENLPVVQVRVCWRPPPTDTIGLVGEAATGYRVYTSSDGLGWSNGVPVTAGTAYTVTGLSSDQLVFVRVTATNAGGESFPTETLAVRVGDDAGILLVNGFDRLNRTMLVPEDDPVEGYNLRMFLDQMNRYDYVVQHGQAITHSFDSASNEAVQEGLVSLDDYGVLDWILGEESTEDETLNGTEQALLSSFLAGGGGLFISGAEIGWDLCYQGSVYDCGFYTGTLRAEYVGDDAETYEVTPTVGGFFEGLDSFRFDADGMYDPDYPDQIAPTSGSVPALLYSGGLAGTAAIQYAEGENACPRVVYFGFPFETTEADRRAEVMARVMDFLIPCLPQSPSTWIHTPAHLSAHNTTPPFEGVASSGPTTLQRVEVQVRRPDGDYWTGSAWVTSAIWITASGTDVWSYTLPTLSDNGDYQLRARAWTAALSDTSPAEVAFTFDTIPPTNTSLITPTGGITIPSMAGVVLTWEPVGPDGGSSLAYVVRLDGQPYTTTQTAYTVSQIAAGSHTWGVQVFDGAGNRSEWVTETFSVSQYRYVLPVVMRNFGEGVSACADVVVNGGFETDDGWILNRLAVYDTVRLHSGARSVRVGIPPEEPGQYAYSSVMQQIALPGGSSATLRLWVYPIGEGGDSGDRHYVTLYDQSGVPHYLESRQSNSQTWEQWQYDLSPYVGQTVTLYIGTKNDGDDDTAAMYIDDVALEVCP